MDNVNTGMELRARFGLLAESDLAEMLAMRVQTLQAWRAKRRGPDFVKLGKSVFYRADDVKEWINSSIVITDRSVAVEIV